jgi:phosphoribosyl-dephospho-CoA transferase
VDGQRKPEELSDEERQRLHRAHQRLRNASQALEALTVVEPLRGRWKPNPAPPEALDAAVAELHTASEELWSAQRELLGLEPSPGT